MKIIFIRHSKTKIDPLIPITSWGLSNDGIEFAKKLSTNEIITGIEVLYTSLQTKALETGVILAKPNAIPIKTDDRLTEVTSFTQPFEKDFEKYKQNVEQYYLGTIERIGKGETKKEAINRFMHALTEIVHAEKGKQNIGIVSHGNILTLFSSQYRNIDCYKFHTQIKQPDLAIFDWETKEFISFFGELMQDNTHWIPIDITK